jgi:uncharacterized protein YkwD
MALAFPFTAPASAGSCAHAKAPAKAISTRQAKSAVACLLNKRRHSHGLGSLKLNHDLSKASRDHSKYMERHDCFDHECPGEATLDSRLRGVHYLLSGLSSWLYGENIAYGTGSHGSPAAMTKAWMRSAGHRANILNGSFRDFGVGVVWGTPGNPHGDGGLYTTDFGYRR